MSSEAAVGGTATPMMKQYLAIKRKYPDCILFFRMGDFYEMFMDDAVAAAGILNIALTSRDKGKENAVPMCGIPYHAAESYMTRLVQAGRKVAICDQVEDPARARGLVRREVTRVVTPGTAVEEALLTAAEPSYLAAITAGGDSLGLALADISTGSFRFAQLDGPDAAAGLSVLLARFAPKEVLLPEDTDAGAAGRAHVTRIEPYRFDPGMGRDNLCDFFSVGTVEGFGLGDKPLAVGACAAILWYLQEVHPGQLAHLNNPRPAGSTDRLVLDGSALEHLEILRSSYDGSRDNTLLAVMDRTVTAMGARRLLEVLVSPLTLPRAIEARLDLVAELVDESIVRDGIRSVLKGVSDLERILSRISAGTVTPREMAALGITLTRVPSVMDALSDLDAALGREILERLDDLQDLAALLSDALADDPPVSLKNGGVVREGFDGDLDRLRSLASDGRRFISELEAREKVATGIPSLKVGFNKVFGYYLEVTNTHRDLVPAGYIRKQTLVNAERYVTEELKEMEESILSAQEKMMIREREIFQSLCSRTLGFAAGIQKTARALADTDLFSSLAELAHTSGYCRPVILADDPEQRISITGGRHPVLEVAPDMENFVPNDTWLDCHGHRMMILTGPNMAGKSTYMRQVALMVIMAQTGSFVPAAEALISPVDRIFTRVGAQDVLSRGLSTFMVEMVETAEILNGATDSSLIVLDEIGRGTSTFDGLSIAWAVAEHLLEGPARGCRTMFATHYHELTELALLHEGAKNCNVAIREWGDRLVFLHRIEDGAADRSYGIQVGKLAGLPAGVVDRAGHILANLEKQAVDRQGRPTLLVTEEGRAVSDGRGGNPQMALFDDLSGLRRLLQELELDGITPIEALNVLADLKRRYS